MVYPRWVLIGELARRVGRSPDTIKRWLDQGLLNCERDERNRRIFTELDVERCSDLIRLSIAAQVQNKKLAELADNLPVQLSLVQSN
jgi:DNA-binding transcriptional MerR regulator